jgi:hypothetical protein
MAHVVGTPAGAEFGAAGGQLADGQDGPETEWGEHVTHDEYNQQAA